MHESNALLFEDGDNNQMLEAIKQLVVEAELKAEVQLQAIQTIETRQLTWQQNATKIVKLFDVLSKRKIKAVDKYYIKSSV